MDRQHSARQVAPYGILLALFTSVHFGAERLALTTDAVAGIAAPVWLATGFAIAIIFLFGYRYLPAIVVGAFLANLLAPVPLVAVVGATLGATAEASLGVYALRRAGFRPSMERLQDVAALVLLAALLSTTASATLGVVGLATGDALIGESFWRIWLLWWVANAVSVLIVAPPILMLVDRRRRTPQPDRMAPPAAVAGYLGLLAAAAAAVFLPPSVPRLFVFPFAVVPFLLMVALRFGPVGAAIGNALLAVFAVAATSNGSGPFGPTNPLIGPTPQDGLLVAQVFVATFGVTTLAMAAAVAERSSVRDQLTDAERRYRTLVEHIPAATYVDVIEDAETGKVSHLYMSPQIEAILGYRPEEFDADPDLFTSRLHPDDRDATLAADIEHYRTGVAHSSVARMLHRDGREVWIRDEATVATDYDGHERVSQGFLIDITGLMSAQAEMDRLRERLLEAQEEERRGIAAGIHDDALQKITVVGLRIGSLRRKMRPSPEIDEALDQLEFSVQETAARLRHLVFDLQPPILEREGVGAAIREYVAREAEEAGFNLHVEDTLAAEPGGPVQAAMYRIAQEALHNAVKHAQAENVRVVIEDRDGGFALEITDDGLGFNPDHAGGRPDHFGLSAMVERAAIIGGWCKVHSSAGGGTTVEVWLPAPHRTE